MMASIVMATNDKMLFGFMTVTLDAVRIHTKPCENMKLNDELIMCAGHGVFIYEWFFSNGINRCTVIQHQKGVI